VRAVADIATGWTECVALLIRDSALIVEALERVRTTMPFALRGVDTDNGSEFINEALIAYCKDTGIEFTRSRPYRKNDRRGSSRRTGLSFAALPATAASRGSPRPARSPGSTRHRACS